MNRIGTYFLWTSAALGVFLGLAREAEWIWPPPPMVEAAVARSCYEQGFNHGKLREAADFARAKGWATPADLDKRLAPTGDCAVPNPLPISNGGVVHYKPAHHFLDQSKGPWPTWRLPTKAECKDILKRFPDAKECP